MARIDTVIAYKNLCALIAYYLGIFSIIPFAGILLLVYGGRERLISPFVLLLMGMLLGLAAVILGILGLRYARNHPQAKGKVHAWIGIIVGGMCAVGSCVLVQL